MKRQRRVRSEITSGAKAREFLKILLRAFGGEGFENGPDLFGGVRGRERG